MKLLILTLAACIPPCLALQAQDNPYKEIIEASTAFVDVLEEVGKIAVKQTEEIETLKSSVGSNGYKIEGFGSSIARLTDRVEALESSPPDMGIPISDPDYLPVISWSDLTTKVKAGKPVRVDHSINVSSNVTLKSGKAIKFGSRGGLKLSGYKITINLPVINEDNHQIFYGVENREAYPNRWKQGATSVEGTFGGNNRRDPRWWGLMTSLGANQGLATQAWINNDAIASAVLSSSRKNTTGGQLRIILPTGRISIIRTIRIDGMRCALIGQGMNATQLWAHSSRFDFDTSLKILTEEFPEGTTPVIEMGYRIQKGSPNPDQGFMSVVKGLSIVCPMNPTDRVSGIMWSGGGLQEGSKIEDVNVQKHSGIGIGGPRFQSLEFNGTPKNYYMQLNGFRGHNWWIFDPNPKYNDVIGIAIGGITFNIDTVTVDHGRGAGGVQTRPAVIAGAREAGLLSNFHIEYAPGPGADGVGILIPRDNNMLQRMTLTGIAYLPSRPFRPELIHRTVRIEGRGGISCRSITCKAGEKYGRAIEDTVRGKVSSGYHYRTASSYVAQYDRQQEISGYIVTTTDPDLK